MPAVNTKALAGRGETWRWASAAAGASGDRVLTSLPTRVHMAHTGLGAVAPLLPPVAAAGSDLIIVDDEDVSEAVHVAVDAVVDDRCAVQQEL